MYFDWTYLVLVLPAVIFAMWASSKVKTTFNKYSTVRSLRGLTGCEAAETVLRENGIFNVRVEAISGKLTDHFDPKSNVIRLSSEVYGSNSCAAIGVAAHEAGHAIQHAQGYTPIKIRSTIVPITNIGSRIAMPLIFIGIFLSYYGEQYAIIAYAGIICFALTALFQLVTLPTEFNASSRALNAIKTANILNESELDASKKILTAAALTYVAALAVSLTQLLHLLNVVNRRTR